MKKLLSCFFALSLGCLGVMAETLQAEININDKVKYQHVTGFGGFAPSPTWQYWLSNAEIDKLFGKGEGQLGLNIMRLYMANSRNAWSAGVANAKRAKKYGAFIFASPWSPPASWKTNNSDSNGGELLESRYADWANFLNDYYKYMKQQGVEIDAVSIQNEPDWKASYQSCIWTGEKLANFLRENGNLIECKVIAPEAIHFTKSMHEPILNDPEACQHLDILGGHFYGWDGSSYPLAAQKGKEVWMTEFLINERQNNEGKDINWEDDGFLFAQNINDAMLANMSAWVHYSLKRFYGCLGDGTYGTVNNEITKRGYILSHFAKYVSGTTRVAHATTDAAGKLSASVYLSVTGDSIVVMAINPSANSYEVKVTLPFNSLGVSSIVTDATLNMAKSDIAFDGETYMPTLDVLPYSVNTFVFEKSSDRPDSGGDQQVQGEVVFTDNFDMYGAGCVPPGWRVRYEDGTRYAGEYGLGPRVMSFSREGIMPYAFYFRTNSSANGYISYGEEASYPLYLEPGTYMLRSSTSGWKAVHPITISVMKDYRTPIASTTVTPETFVSANGSSVRITNPTDAVLQFDINAGAKYYLRWTLQKTTGALDEVLVGNISLIKHDDSGIGSITVDPLTDDNIYDIYGRRVKEMNHPGIYIRNGQKIVVR